MSQYLMVDVPDEAAKAREPTLTKNRYVDLLITFTILSRHQSQLKRMQNVGVRSLVCFILGVLSTTEQPFCSNRYFEKSRLPP